MGESIPVSIIPFPWTKSYETGIFMVDEQHRKLVGLLNDLADYPRDDPDKTSAFINKVLLEMAEYATFHFRCEEDLWRKYFKDHPLLDEHLRLHDDFLPPALGIVAAKGRINPAEAIQDTIEHLAVWLRRHILGGDMRMARIIQNIDSGTPPEEAVRLGSADWAA